MFESRRGHHFMRVFEEYVWEGVSTMRPHPSTEEYLSHSKHRRSTIPPFQRLPGGWHMPRLARCHLLTILPVRPYWNGPFTYKFLSKAIRIVRGLPPQTDARNSRGVHTRDLPNNVSSRKALLAQPGNVLGWRTPKEAPVFPAELRRAQVSHLSARKGRIHHRR